MQQVDVVLQPDPVAGVTVFWACEEAQDHRPDDRHVDEDQQADEERPDEEPEAHVVTPADPASWTVAVAGRSGGRAAGADQGRGGHVSRTAGELGVDRLLRLGQARVDVAALADDGGGGVGVGGVHLRRPGRVAGVPRSR